nr:uncharacterized protein LOC127316267 [Lolium perenne]
MAEQGGKTTSSWRSFRWLYMARLAVASIVTVVAVAVIIRAVVVMLRPEKLQLKLAGGHIQVAYIPSLPPPGNVVTFRFVLRANNPSGHASVLYSNVTVRLTEASSSSSSSPAPEARVAEFGLPEDITVPQQTAHEAIVIVSLEAKEDVPEVPMRYVRALYEVRGVAGVEMELSGLLSTKVARATTKVRATYYCRLVSVAVGPVAYTVADVPCLDQLDAPAHV